MGRLGGLSHLHVLLQVVSSTALRISCVTASGCDTMDACEAAACSIRAFPRSANSQACPVHCLLVYALVYLIILPPL